MGEKLNPAEVQLAKKMRNSLLKIADTLKLDCDITMETIDNVNDEILKRIWGLSSDKAVSFIKDLGINYDYKITEEEIESGYKSLANHISKLVNNGSEMRGKFNMMYKKLFNGEENPELLDNSTVFIQCFKKVTDNNRIIDTYRNMIESIFRETLDMSIPKEISEDDLENFEKDVKEKIKHLIDKDYENNKMFSDLKVLLGMEDAKSCKDIKDRVESLINDSNKLRELEYSLIYLDSENDGSKYSEIMESFRANARNVDQIFDKAKNIKDFDIIFTNKELNSSGMDVNHIAHLIDKLKGQLSDYEKFIQSLKDCLMIPKSSDELEVIIAKVNEIKEVADKFFKFIKAVAKELHIARNETDENIDIFVENTIEELKNQIGYKNKLCRGLEVIAGKCNFVFTDIDDSIERIINYISTLKEYNSILSDSIRQALICDNSNLYEEVQKLNYEELAEKIKIVMDSRLEENKDFSNSFSRIYESLMLAPENTSVKEKCSKILNSIKQKDIQIKFMIDVFNRISGKLDSNKVLDIDSLALYCNSDDRKERKREVTDEQIKSILDRDNQISSLKSYVDRIHAHSDIINRDMSSNLSYEEKVDEICSKLEESNEMISSFRNFFNNIAKELNLTPGSDESIETLVFSTIKDNVKERYFLRAVYNSVKDVLGIESQSQEAFDESTSEEIKASINNFHNFLDSLYDRCNLSQEDRDLSLVQRYRRVLEHLTQNDELIQAMEGYLIKYREEIGYMDKREVMQELNSLPKKDSMVKESESILCSIKDMKKQVSSLKKEIDSYKIAVGLASDNVVNKSNGELSSGSKGVIAAIQEKDELIKEKEKEISGYRASLDDLMEALDFHSMATSSKFSKPGNSVRSVSQDTNYGVDIQEKISSILHIISDKDNRITNQINVIIDLANNVNRLRRILTLKPIDIDLDIYSDIHYLDRLVDLLNFNEIIEECNRKMGSSYNLLDSITRIAECLNIQKFDHSNGKNVDDLIDKIKEKDFKVAALCNFIYALKKNLGLLNNDNFTNGCAYPNNDNGFDDSRGFNEHSGENSHDLNCGHKSNSGKLENNVGCEQRGSNSTSSCVQMPLPGNSKLKSTNENDETLEDLQEILSAILGKDDEIKKLNESISLIRNILGISSNSGESSDVCDIQASINDKNFKLSSLQDKLDKISKSLTGDEFQADDVLPQAQHMSSENHKLRYLIEYILSMLGLDPSIIHYDTDDLKSILDAKIGIFTNITESFAKLGGSISPNAGNNNEFIAEQLIAQYKNSEESLNNIKNEMSSVARALGLQDDYKGVKDLLRLINQRREEMQRLSELFAALDRQIRSIDPSLEKLLPGELGEAFDMIKSKYQTVISDGSVLNSTSASFQSVLKSIGYETNEHKDPESIFANAMDTLILQSQIIKVLSGATSHVTSLAEAREISKKHEEHSKILNKRLRQYVEQEKVIKDFISKYYVDVNIKTKLPLQTIKAFIMKSPIMFQNETYKLLELRLRDSILGKIDGFERLINKLPEIIANKLIEVQMIKENYRRVIRENDDLKEKLSKVLKSLFPASMNLTVNSTLNDISHLTQKLIAVSKNLFTYIPNVDPPKSNQVYTMVVAMQKLLSNASYELADDLSLDLSYSDLSRDGTNSRFYQYESKINELIGHLSRCVPFEELIKQFKEMYRIEEPLKNSDEEAIVEFFEETKERIDNYFNLIEDFQLYRNTAQTLVRNLESSLPKSVNQLIQILMDEKKYENYG